MKFKYITLNSLHGGQIWDNFIDFLSKENPDILAIQEAFNSKNPTLSPNYRTIDELKKILNFSDVFYSPEYLNENEVGNIDIGNAIFSKFPIVQSKVSFFEKPYGKFNHYDKALFPFYPTNIQHAKVNLNGTTLNIFNTHGIWGEDGLDHPRRLQMSEKIVDQVKEKENVILSGDFNVNQETKSMENIEKYLLNIFKGELKSSFNMRRKPKNSGYNVAVVDNIFISPNIKVVEHYCPDVDVSDHFPLVAILEV